MSLRRTREQRSLWSRWTEHDTILVTSKEDMVRRTFVLMTLVGLFIAVTPSQLALALRPRLCS
jgi:hypothetical protein